MSNKEHYLIVFLLEFSSGFIVAGLIDEVFLRMNWVP